MIVAGLVCQAAFYLTLMWYGEMTEGHSRQSSRVSDALSGEVTN